MNVYIIHDIYAGKVKIGKANDVHLRLQELQVGNPNELRIANIFPCNSDAEALLLEQQLHQKYDEYWVRGEWFEYLEEFESDIPIESTKRIQPNALILNTFEGQKAVVSHSNHPRCFFYPQLVAHIQYSYEDSLKHKQPYRTMEYPTYGERKLMPYSDKLDRVFISDRKYRENLALKKFLKEKEKKCLTLWSNL